MKVIIITRTEATYNKFLKTVFNLANPIKKSIIKTHCIVHMHINIYALKILKNDNYLAQYNFFGSYIIQINEGAVWADQDFKSSNHFYNPDKEKGMYGRNSAMDLGVDYYNQALKLWNTGDYNKSMFYLGAALHIIQDMTVPQHANIRLLDDHRQYETYIKRSFNYLDDIDVKTGTYLLGSIEDYVRFNARVALKIYRRFQDVKDDETRFYNIGKCSLPLAMRTTAGAMVIFYNDIFSINLNKLN